MTRLSILVALSLLVADSAAAQDALRPAGPAVPLVAEDGTTLSRPVWSPDGQMIAFAGGDAGGLWVAAADGSGLRELSAEMGAGYAPEWSPDGSALLTRASRYEDGRRLSAVVVIDAVTGTTRALTTYRSSMPTLPTWSADGSEALLLTDGRLERFDTGRAPVLGKTAGRTIVADGRRLAVVAPDREAATVPLSFDERLLNVSPSPDGSQVAFEVLGGNLYVVDSDGTNLVDLGRGYRPAWSPDGAWIAYQQTTDDGHTFTAADLYAVRADGSDRVQLTTSAERLEMSPAWRPDGRALAFEVIDEGILYLLPLAR